MTAQPDFNNHEERSQTVGYATTELHDAVHDLAGMRKGSVDTDSGRRTGVRDSRYTEIMSDIQGQQGTAFGGVARSMPPLWVDAVDWLKTVDTTVAEWTGDNGRATTPDRLFTLTELTWRPQDVPLLQRMTETILRWCKKADVLLDPPKTHTWELTAPCPACNTTTVHRPDTGGDWVRQAALVITEAGCTCQACKTAWSPEYFTFLARTIGCDIPNGVLE